MSDTTQPRRPASRGECAVDLALEQALELRMQLLVRESVLGGRGTAVKLGAVLLAPGLQPRGERVVVEEELAHNGDQVGRGAACGRRGGGGGRGRVLTFGARGGRGSGGGRGRVLVFGLLRRGELLELARRLRFGFGDALKEYRVELCWGSTGRRAPSCAGPDTAVACRSFYGPKRLTKPPKLPGFKILEDPRHGA